MQQVLLCLIFLTLALPTCAKQGTVTLAAVGDVFFARGVGEQISKHGPNWLFDGTRSIIKGADLASCNLECPLSKRGLPQKRRFLFRSDPRFAETLHTNGFDVVSLANNHVLDYGRDAMLDTICAARKAGLTPVGAGKNGADAGQVRVVKSNNLRVGFLAYMDLPTIGVVRLSDRPTVAGVDANSVPRQIRAAKLKCDVLVVSFHWGVEYMKLPTERQKKLAHLCVDSGADLVLGHHPHVLQPLETYKGKPIAYSLGAFIWDGRVLDADRSAIYLFEISKSASRLKKRVPVRIRNCQPKLDSSTVGR